MSDDAPSRGSRSSWEVWLVVVACGVLAVFAGLAGRAFFIARNIRAKNPCIANLRQIDGAVQQWALENKKSATDTHSLSDTALLEYLKGSKLPVCPEHGRYLPGASITNVPRCTIGGNGHSL